MIIPVNKPLLSKDAKRNVEEALQTKWLSSSGPFVGKFEKEFAARFGVKHAIAVSNGTAALHTALLSLGIGEGDEVIVPAFTMAASWMAIIYTGAKPIFVDCELDTYNIDTSKIEEKITSKTKAIMVVHIYGHPSDMETIIALAKQYDLKIVEDAAEATGAEYRGELCGTMGDLGCFSFYANKIITTGEGGMIITNDDDLAKEARKLKDLYHSDEKRFIHEKIGYNYRMTNLQAAVGCGELMNLSKYLEIKKMMAATYSAGLKDVVGLKLPATKPGVKNVFWMYAVLVEKEFGMTRNELRAALFKKGVDTRDFFYAPENQPVLANLKMESNPNTTYISESGLYLPSGLAITKKQILSVVATVKEINKSNR